MKKIDRVPFEKDVMPIGGYFGPYRAKAPATKSGNHKERYYDYVTDKIYQLIKESGVNLVVNSDNDYLREGGKEQILDNLALCEKYQIGMFVRDNRITGEESTEQLEEYLKEFREFESFRGISITDEPFTSYYGAEYYEAGIRRLEDFAKKSSLLNQTPNCFGYINLNPLGRHLAAEDVLEEQYDRYVEEYITTCHPRAISWDYYPFGGTIYYDAGEKRGYFNNLKLMREKSLKYDIPFWSYVQAGYHWNDGENDPGEWDTDDTIPTETELLWNVNTALAYGAKGIEYFSLIQPYWFAYGGRNGALDNFNRNGLIGADGSKTQWFSYAKKANEWVATIDEILMNATSKALLAVGEKVRYDTGITDTSGGPIASIQAENEVLVGLFEYQGKTACYVVNYNTELAGEIAVQWKVINDYLLHIQGVEGSRNDTSDKCRFTLEPGHAALVVI